MCENVQVLRPKNNLNNPLYKFIRGKGHYFLSDVFRILHIWGVFGPFLGRLGSRAGAGGGPRVKDKDPFLPVKYSQLQLEEIYKYVTISDLQKAFFMMRLKIHEALHTLEIELQDGRPRRDIVAIIQDLADDVEDLRARALRGER